MNVCEPSAKYAVLAFDCSGSVEDDTPIFQQLYWPNVEKLFKRLLYVYKENVFVIRWDHTAEKIDFKTVEKMCKEKFGYGGTLPNVIWPVLQNIIDQNKANDFTYDLYLTTDGEVVDHGEYVEEYQKISLKPTQSYLYFWGYGDRMLMSFLDAFPPPVEYYINGIDSDMNLYQHKSIKADSNALYNSLIALPEYQFLLSGPAEIALERKNLSNLYITLYRKYAEYSETELKGDIGKNFIRFGNDVNQNGQKWLVAIKNLAQQEKRVIEIMLKKILELANGNMEISRKIQVYGKQSSEQLEAFLMKE